MAIIHRATISPTKEELLERILGGPVTMLGAYRFDDPRGEVGVEALIARCGAKTSQVVLTYRGAPLEGAEEHLVSTMEHSALGRRWVYDGASDPVARSCFRRALRGEQEQAGEEIWDGDERVGTRDPSVRVSLVPDRATDADVEAGLVIARDLDLSPESTSGSCLRAEWNGGAAVVASLR